MGILKIFEMFLFINDYSFNDKSFLFLCSSSLVYLKLLVLWGVVIVADYFLEFRFEYLWPFWLFLRSVYDSFKYQGLVSYSIIFIFYRVKIFFFSWKDGTSLVISQIWNCHTFFPASLQAKTAGISKLVDDEAGSIL